MGLIFTKLSEMLSSLSEGPPKRILMLGLDAAGKTTVLYKLKLNEAVTTIPTIGFNVEEVRLGKGLSFTVWDVGGQNKIRQLWQHYFQNSRGLLFVVDSSEDSERMKEARHELHQVLAADQLRDIPVVVMANKQDLPHAKSPAQVADALALRELPSSHRWHIQGVTAVTGDGLYEAVEALGKLVT